MYENYEINEFFYINIIRERLFYKVKWININELLKREFFKYIYIIIDVLNFSYIKNFIIKKRVIYLKKILTTFHLFSIMILIKISKIIYLYSKKT